MIHAEGGRCQSGKHIWSDEEDRKRCCDPNYVRVQGLWRSDLEDMGAEHIVFRQIWRGWKRLNLERVKRRLVSALKGADL